MSPPVELFAEVPVFPAGGPHTGKNCAALQRTGKVGGANDDVALRKGLGQVRSGRRPWPRPASASGPPPPDPAEEMLLRITIGLLTDRLRLVEARRRRP
jgi:hypothetical protein